MNNPQYVNDIGQIVDKHKDTVLIKLIPKIDYENLEKLHLKSQNALNNLMNPNYQPPFALFDPSKLNFEIKKIAFKKYWPKKGDIEGIYYDGDIYIGKFLYKKFSFTEIKILEKVERKKFNLFKENFDSVKVSR